MADDGELLRQYVENRSEGAFAELVQRHLNLVYSAALRQVGGDVHRAREVSQSVFADLARKAAGLAGRPTLAGWLYLATHRAAARLWRTELRRRAREQKAYTMQEILGQPEPAPDWAELRPVLDAALRQLSHRDREAVLLRFFEGCPFADIGARLRLSQDAARMRVDRALERLRVLLGQGGLTSTTGALALVLANQATAAAPAGLAAAISASAMAGGTGAGAVSTLLQLMQITKVQMAVAAVVFAAAAATGVREIRANQNLESEIAVLERDNQALPQLRADYLRLRKIDSDLSAAVAATAQAKASARGKADDAGPTEKRAKPIDSIAAALVVGPIYEADELDEKPVAIDQTNPVYPFALRRNGVSGRATVDFVVAADGGVVGAHVVSSSSPEFADSALTGVSQWVFRPGQKAGAPANAHMQVPVVFGLSGK